MGGKRILWKFIGFCKVGISTLTNECAHVNNENLFSIGSRDTKMVVGLVDMDIAKKRILFGVNYNMLKLGRPIMDDQ